MSGKYPVLYICRFTLNGRFDSHKAINNAFPPEHYDVTTIFLHGTMSPEQIAAYYGRVIFWELEKHSFMQQKVI